jgi:hypothetical protein
MNQTPMKPGDRYNWKNQPENLIYLGMCEPRNGQWHQFAKVEKPDEVWCEVHPQDLHMLEVTARPDILVTDGKGLSPSALIAMGIASSSHFQPARKVRRPKLNQPPAEAQRLIEAAEAKRARRVAKAIKWGAV